MIRTIATVVSLAYALRPSSRIYSSIKHDYRRAKAEAAEQKRRQQDPEYIRMAERLARYFRMFFGGCMCATP